MKFKLLILLIFSLCFTSCKTNFQGKRFTYSDNDIGSFKMAFINDSILEVYPKSIEKSVFKYKILKIEILEQVKDNQPPVNFKTRKLNGQFLQNIALEKIKGNSVIFKKYDTLTILKIRSEKIMTKKMYFYGGNKFIDL